MQEERRKEEDDKREEILGVRAQRDDGGRTAVGLLAAAGDRGGSESAGASGSAEEEMDRKLGDAGTLSVPYNEAGTYEVVFTESDLAQMSANDESGQDEEMTRDDGSIEVEATEDEASGDQEEALEVVESDEGSATQDEATIELEDANAAAPEEVVAIAEEGFKLADATQDDVRVEYKYSLVEAEPGYEMRTASITGFANDGGTVTVSFTNPDTQEYTPTYFDIVIDRLASHVEVYPEFPEPEVITVDYDAQLDAIEYEPDFSPEDIALPEGVEIVDGTVVVSEDASNAVVEALSEDPSVEVEAEMTRGGDDKKDDKDDPWKYSDAATKYSTEALYYVDEDAGKIADFGKTVYDLVKNGYTGNIDGVFESGKHFLKLLGIGKGGSQGVTNEQLLDEIKALKNDVADLKLLMTNMSLQLEKNLQESYAIHLQSFDDAVYALGADADVVSSMYRNGALLAEEEEGLVPPDEDAPKEEQFAYNKKLKSFIVSQAKDDNEAFEDFQEHVKDLRKNYNIVVSELRKTGTFSPLSAYDSYWDMYFNWQSQGYYLRQSYRSNIEYQLKRGFAVLAVYYNFGSPSVGDTYDTYIEGMQNALKNLEDNSAGISPEKVAQGYQNYTFYTNYLTNHVYSGTFERTATELNVSYTSDNSWKQGKFDKSVLIKYSNKMHGRDLEQDLLLAGIWPTRGEYAGYNLRYGKTGKSGGVSDAAHGLGVNPSSKSKTHYVDLMTFDGKIYENAPTYKGMDTISAYGGLKSWRFNYICFAWE